MFSLTHFIHQFQRVARKAKKRKFRKEIKQLSLKERFSRIYSINYWGHQESLSGKGSTIEHTENLRAYIPALVNELAIQSIFDGPCGDLNWMQHVLKDISIRYVGGDIVPSVIERNIALFSNEITSFIQIDLTLDSFPQVDLMICRDCLFHLSYEDTKKILNNFVNSNIKYLLTTTYENDGTFENTDIISGHFRLIDLHRAPYYFPMDVISKVEDWIYPDNKRYMCLWHREQIMEAVKKFRE
jgi:hypothetical protein